jgi:hypothetical protein
MFHPPTCRFDGDITFALGNGLQVRVPNNQFLVPFVDIDRNGSRTIDRSKRELLMNGISDQPATLGRYFFTAAYLMVNHDAQTFTMWQANPSAKATLVPVLGETPGACGNQVDVDTGASSGAPVNVGAIVGGTVGGTVGIAAVAVAIIMFLRIRKRKTPKLSTWNNGRLPSEVGLQNGLVSDSQTSSTETYVGPHEAQGTYSYPRGEVVAELQAHSKISEAP